MARFLTPLITEEILGSKYARMVEPFRYYSDILNRIIELPINFYFDYESVPLVKGTSKRGGAIHDYLCRCNSKPVVSKQTAASVYLETMVCRDALLIANAQAHMKKDGGRRSAEITLFDRFDMFCRRQVKTAVVRVAPGYFHKLPVEATLDELITLNGLR